jgi:hypothetical protein
MKLTRRAQELFPDSRHLRRQWLRIVFADSRAAVPRLIMHGAKASWSHEAKLLYLKDNLALH